MVADLVIQESSSTVLGIFLSAPAGRKSDKSLEIMILSETLLVIEGSLAENLLLIPL